MTWATGRNGPIAPPIAASGKPMERKPGNEAFARVRSRIRRYKFSRAASNALQVGPN